MKPAPGERRDIEEPPPFGGTWKRLYAIVAGELLVIIVALYVFTQVLS